MGVWSVSNHLARSKSHEACHLGFSENSGEIHPKSSGQSSFSENCHGFFLFKKLSIRGTSQGFPQKHDLNMAKLHRRGTHTIGERVQQLQVLHGNLVLGTQDMAIYGDLLCPAQKNTSATGSAAKSQKSYTSPRMAVRDRKCSCWVVLGCSWYQEILWSWDRPQMIILMGKVMMIKLWRCHILRQSLNESPFSTQSARVLTLQRNPSWYDMFHLHQTKTTHFFRNSPRFNQHRQVAHKGRATRDRAWLWQRAPKQHLRMGISGLLFDFAKP